MKYYIGIDGGASSTRAVLINENGQTLNKKILHQGSNLKVYENLSCTRITQLILDLCSEISIPVNDVSALGLGLASISYDRGREMLFKELDRIKISDKTILMNDAEAAYNVICQDNVGILVTVGTGVICIAKKSDGNFVRTSGKGHDIDIGSGYWIGKETLLQLALNQSIIAEDSNLSEIMDIVHKKFQQDDFNSILEDISNSDDSLSLKASISKDMIEISNHNDIALKILQEATCSVADYIIDLNQSLDYKSNNDLVLFGNGSVVRSPIYRKSLNDALSFHFPKINWILSDLSAAYGPAMLAALSKDENKITVKQIIKGDYLVSC